MAGLTYRGRELGHHQYESWRGSVHGQAMLEKGDPSAATCNDCHGNHGAVPPDADSVANACGMCHSKVAGLFADASMKHRFEEEDVNLPGCAACHGDPDRLDADGNTDIHGIRSHTDEMLGMGSGAVCARCHEEGKTRFGATVAGAKIAQAMRDELEGLKRDIAAAEEKVGDAERMGMEVRGPRFDLRQATDALINARALIHSFALDPVKEAVGEGLEITVKVKQLAEAALAEHTRRRVWLAASLVPIGLVLVLLLLYIRTLPLPAK
jgi:hypothetical protein